MAYQFVHIQTYCPKLMQVSGTKDQFNSTEQVFGEAARDPHYSKHVEGPQRPIAVKNFGAVSVAELRRLHDERRAEIRETVRGSGGKRKPFRRCTRVGNFMILKLPDHAS